MLKSTLFLLLVAVSLVHTQVNSEGPNPVVTCPCIYPRIYNPVCGDDNVTYDNRSVVRCVNRCNNSNVQVLYKGACGNPVTKPPST